MEELNYLKIIGCLNIDSPLIIIYDVAISHGIFIDNNKFSNIEYIQYIIELIEKSPKKKVNLNSSKITERELKDLARFVNIQEKWEKDPLIKAYEFLIGNHKLEDIATSSFGPQTLEDLYSLNNCILYKLCLDSELELRRYSGKDEMLYALSGNLFYKNNIFNIHKIGEKIDNLLENINSDVEEELYSKIEEKEKSLEMIKENVITLNDLLNDRNDEISDMQDKIDTLSDELRKCKNELASFISDNSIGTNKSQFNSSLTELLTNEMEFVKSEIQGMRTDIILNKGNEQEIQRLREELESQSSTILKLESLNISMLEENSKIEILEKESNKLREIVSSSDADLAETKSLLFKANNKINSLEISQAEVLEKQKNLEENREIITFENLIKSHEALHNIKYIQSSLKPVTHTGAIALAAILFLKDISMAKQPLKELESIKEDPFNYTPLDSEMNYWWNKNNLIFDLNKYFNPLFPYMYYPKEILENLLLNYGISNQEEDEFTIYSILSSVHSEGGFIPSLIPNCNESTYITCEKIKNIPDKEILSFGIFGKGSDAYTYEEIYESFIKNKYLAFPKNLEVLSSEKVSSLLSCVHSSKSEFKERLINIITYLFNMQEENESSIRKILNEKSQVEREEIITVLKKLLYCGMSMRGWKKGNSYPITSEETSVKNEDELMIIVNENIREYNSLKPEFLEIVNNLPLVYYRKGKFIEVKEESEGKTIGKRLDILISDKDDNACIRLSSNFFIHSAYKYLVILGIVPDFNISEISLIH